MTRRLRQGSAWMLLGAMLALVLGVVAHHWRRGAASVPQPVPAPVLVSDAPSPADRIEAAPGRLRDFNVLILTTDTTRADHLGCYGNGRIETPVIDGLAHGGVRCETALTPSPSTVPGHCSLLTGLYPHHHGVRANGTFKLNQDLTTLAERLRGSGYATAAVISAAVLDSRYGLDQGFDHYDDDLTRGRKFTAHMFRERPAELTDEPALSWLRGHAREKFFLWVHYFDPHAAYLPPEPYRTRYRDNLYDGEIAYADSQIGAVMDELERLGVRDRTLVVYTSDHGEGLGEHGEQTHSLLIYDATLHVPLIFNAPSSLPPGTIRRQVSLVDVVPTVLALLGEPVPHDLDGISLCEPPPVEPRCVFIETISTMTLHGWAPLLGVRRDDFKYILAPTPELYDLRADPGELSNIHDARPETVAALSGQLTRMIGGDPFLAARGIQSNVALDEKTRRELAALGYLATVGRSPPQPARDPKEMVYRWEKLQHGLNLHAAGRMREALPILEECVAEVEGDIFARQVLAGCYLLRGDLDKALELSRRTAELETNDETIWLSIAAAHIGRGELEESERAIDRALAIEPESAPAHVQRGRLALRRGDEEAALRLFRQAIEMDPGTTGPDAWDEIGFLHLRAARLDEARQAFYEAIAIDALDGAARDGLANVFIEEGKLDEAQQALTLALRFDPNQPRAMATLASIMIERGGLEVAVSLCERALELSPRHPHAHNALGLAYRRQGNLDRAEEHYREAIANGPWLDAPHVNFAQLCLRQGRNEEALRQFELALRANPYCAVALANLGAWHFNEGRVDRGFALYQRALQVKPGYALAHKHIASIYALRDDPHRAAFHLRRSLELDPDQADADQVGYALAQAAAEAAARPHPEGLSEPAASPAAGVPGAAASPPHAPAPRPGGPVMLAGRGADRGPWSLLLVTLDTTRADRLGCYGYRHAETPALDALAAEGVTYQSCYAPVPLTLPSHCSIMTGLWPPRHGVRVNGAESLPDEAQTLAEILSRRGYATGAVVGAAVLDRHSGIDQGFADYDAEFGSQPGRFDYAQRDAGAVTDSALRWLAERRDAPWFLWVHYFDPHAPYEPPGYSPGLATRSGYDSEITFVDAHLKRLLDAADRSAAGALVIVAADHGEGLWEHGEPAHGLFAYDSTLRVPLVVRFPDRRLAGLRLAQRVSLADVMPSALGWLSIEAPADLDGKELPLGAGSAREARPLYFENRAPAELYGWSALCGIISGDSKLILAPQPERYDLARDPHERDNLYAASDSESAELRGRLEELLGELAGRSLPPGAANLSEQDAARLQALGYVGAKRGAGEPPPADAPDPKDMVRVSWQLLAATTLLEQQRPAEAGEELLGILAQDPTNRRAALLLADLARQPDVVPGIVEALQSAAGRRYGQAIDVYLRGQLGLALASLGRHAEAAEAFSAALDADPSSAPAHANLARALLELDRPREAAEALEESLRLDPSLAGASHLLGVARQRQGQPP